MAARAADYYVATNGATNNAGTMAAPWTFAKAVGSTGAGPGDTVYVRGGTYNGAINFTRSGSASAWITFRAYQGELPVIQGTSGSGVSSSTAQYVRFIGIAVRNFASSGFGNGWVNDTGTSNGNLQFINCIADNNGINGIAFYNATGILIENSIVAHNGNGSPSQSWSSGVNLFHVMGGASANIVRGNVSFENIDISSHHSDGSGFILDQMSDGASFINNIGFHNGGSCIRLTNSPGALIVNNTCWHNGLDPNSAMGAPASPGEIYFSNPNTMQVVAFANNLGAARGYNNTQNAWGGQVPTGQNNYAVNANGATPFWMNPAAIDFRLVAGMTQAIDKGTTTNAPANDIGFDGKCITMTPPAQVTGQQAPPSWWTYSIDYTYIQNIGGIGACFRPGTRSGTPDIGAFEYGTVVTGTGGTGGGTGGAGGATAGTGGGSAGSGGTGGSSAGAGGTTGGTGGTTGGTGGTTGGTGGTTGGAGGTTGAGGRGGTGGGAAGTGTGGRGGTSASAGSGGTGSAGTGGVTGIAGTGGVTVGIGGAGGSASTGAAGTGIVVTGTGGTNTTGAGGSFTTGSAGSNATGSGGSGSTGQAGTTGTGTGSGGDGPAAGAAGGCACAVDAGGSAGGLAALLVVALALVGRRKRRG